MPSSGSSLFSKNTFKSIFTGKDESLTLDNPKKWMVVAHTYPYQTVEGTPRIFKTEFSLWKLRETPFPTGKITSYADASTKAMFDLTRDKDKTSALSARSLKKNWTDTQHCEELAKLLAESVKDIKADQSVAKDIDTRVLGTELYNKLATSNYELQWNLG